jgi:nitroreductase
LHSARALIVRDFTDQPVAPAVLERILANGHRAPSAGFSQGYAFLVLDPLASKQAYLERYAEPDKGWTDRDEARWPVPFWCIDTAFAAMLMLLTAVDQGLGALFFGIPPTVDAAFRAAFGVPDTYDPIGAIALGYPTRRALAETVRRPRRPLEAIVHRGAW